MSPQQLIDAMAPYVVSGLALGAFASVLNTLPQRRWVDVTAVICLSGFAVSFVLILCAIAYVTAWTVAA